jgi:hypothetical protein
MDNLKYKTSLQWEIYEDILAILKRTNIVDDATNEYQSVYAFMREDGSLEEIYHQFDMLTDINDGLRGRFKALNNTYEETMYKLQEILGDNWRE